VCEDVVWAKLIRCKLSLDSSTPCFRGFLLEDSDDKLQWQPSPMRADCCFICLNGSELALKHSQLWHSIQSWEGDAVGREALIKKLATCQEELEQMQLARTQREEHRSQILPDTYALFKAGDELRNFKTNAMELLRVARDNLENCFDDCTKTRAS